MSRFRSIWQASVNATKKALTWNVDDWIPPAEKYIFNFNAMEKLKRWHLYSDSRVRGDVRFEAMLSILDEKRGTILLMQVFPGLSSASLEFSDYKDGLKGVFSSNLSLDFTEDSKWNIKRSGFCGMRSKKFDGFIDLDAYDTIAMRLREDDRCYISTIYTENWINSPRQQEDNSWQVVFVPNDSWYIAKIPLARYVPPVKTPPV